MASQLAIVGEIHSRIMLELVVDHLATIAKPDSLTDVQGIAGTFQAISFSSSPDATAVSSPELFHFPT